MMGFVQLVIILMFVGPLDESLVQAPPRDLASLLAPKVVLQQMGANTDEDSLLALLNPPEREQAARPPEGGDVEYVKKLMAVRALEKMKSDKALPLLEKVAKGRDVTLRQAAREAIAAIRGAPLERPSGVDGLKEVAALLPGDVGFVLMVDLAKGAADRTIDQYVGKANQAGRPQPIVNITGMNMAQVLARFKQGLRIALARAGNVRIDSVTIVVPQAIVEETGYVAVVVKGLFDPVRLSALCETGFDRKDQVGGHTVYSERSGPAVCLLDEHTAVASVGPGGRDNILPVLTALTSGKRHDPCEHAARALELLAGEKIRVAIAGALTEAQKTDIRRELANAANDKPVAPSAAVTRAGNALVRQLTGPDRFWGCTDAGSMTRLVAECPDEQAAANLDKALKMFETELHQFLKNMMERQDKDGMGMRMLFGTLDMKTQFWRSSVKDRSVVFEIDQGMASPPLGFLHLWWLGRMRELSAPPAVRLEVPPDVAP